METHNSDSMQVDQSQELTLFNMKNINAIVSNPDFIKLDRLLNRFNIFEATDMGRKEIKHTKFLAYLLNPNESHGLGDSFLMAFLRTLGLASNVCLMMLHTEMATLSAEWGRGIPGKKGRLDLLIQIPMLDKQGNYLIIAVENKIDAGQGVNQLSYYSELLKSFNKDDVIHKYYLTVQEDEPNDANWSAITYADTVLRAMTQVLESKTDKISDYIRQVLNDYIHLIDEREEDDEEIESLAQKFKPEHIEQIKSSRERANRDPNNLEPAWKNLWVKYPKACKCLADYVNDPRNDVVKYLNDLKNFNKLPDSDLIFNVETTGNSYARFSILLPENARRLIEISKPPSKKWLDSYRNLAFEIVMKEFVENKGDEVENKGGELKKYTIFATFTLGPNTLSPDQRLILINDIREKFNEAPLVDCSKVYTRLIKSKRLNPQGAETLSGKDLLQWIEKLLPKENDSVKLNENVMDIAAKANAGLCEFFKRSQNSN